MARIISAANQNALDASALVSRDFLWMVARNRSDNTPETVGFWSDVDDVTAEVLDPDTGFAVSRDFYGSGTLISIDPIPLVSNLTVQTVTVRLSQLDELVEQAVRDYDCKQARIEIHRGLFSPATRKMVAPAECRFVGFIDLIQIKTPSENEVGGVEITCSSHTQELLRSNPDTRSHESQILRSATDNFFQDAATVGEWEHFWGRKNGKVDHVEAKKPGAAIKSSGQSA